MACVRCGVCFVRRRFWTTAEGATTYDERAASEEAGEMQAAQPPSKVDANLVTLRVRALDLHARLSELRDTAAMLRDGVGPGRGAKWPTFLAQYDTLSRLATQLTEELDRGLTEGLDHLVAVPKALTQDAAVLPELLRTRLDPAVERDFDALGKQFQGDEAATRIAAFNAFVEAEVDAFQDSRDSLARPRPSETPLPTPTPTADVVLAAVASGTGLRQHM